MFESELFVLQIASIITFHTCPLQCCPCTWYRLRSSGHTHQRAHYIGKDGSWGNPSNPSCIHHNTCRMRLDDTGTGLCTCHKAESQILPSCIHRLDRQRKEKGKNTLKHAQLKGGINWINKVLYLVWWHSSIEMLPKVMSTLHLNTSVWFFFNNCVLYPYYRSF